MRSRARPTRRNKHVIRSAFRRARLAPIKTIEPSVIRIASSKSRLRGMKGPLLLHSEPTLPLMKKLPRNRWEQQHGQNRGTDEH